MVARGRISVRSIIQTCDVTAPPNEAHRRRRRRLGGTPSLFAERIYPRATWVPPGYLPIKKCVRRPATCVRARE